MCAVKWNHSHVVCTDLTTLIQDNFRLTYRSESLLFAHFMCEHASIFYGSYFYFLRSSPYNTLSYFFFPFVLSQRNSSEANPVQSNPSKRGEKSPCGTVLHSLIRSILFGQSARPISTLLKFFEYHTIPYSLTITYTSNLLDHIWCFPANPLPTDHRSIKRQLVSSKFDRGLCVQFCECAHMSYMPSLLSNFSYPPSFTFARDFI